MLLKQFGQGVKIDQPFIGVLDFSIFMLLSHCVLEVKPVDIVDG
jgi:hypothetical protein